MERKYKKKYDHPYKRDGQGNTYRTNLQSNIRYQQSVRDRRPQEHTGNKHFSFKRLEKLSDEETCNIVFEMSNKNNGFVDLFNQNKDPDWLFLLIKIVAKICDTEFFECKRDILSEICHNSIFLNHLRSYILKTPTEINTNRRENMEVFFENCLVVWQSITDLFPKTAAEQLNELIISFNMALSGIKISGIIPKINDVLLMDKIENLLQQFKNLKSNNATTNIEENYLQNALPPEDFRTLSVYPTSADIECSKPFLRPNVVKGAYQSIEHYLDVQFRLIHEDFVAPLREAIKCYKQNKGKKNEKRKTIDNIRIYRDVIFYEKKDFVGDKLGYLINFNVKNKLKINWDVSKRFMSGSLLIFTANEFDDFFMGIVLGRDRKHLENGQLMVELLDEVQPKNTASYIMAESEVYFEPYKCAMQVLKTMNTTNFPMAKYIISVQDKIDNPDYLKHLPPELNKYQFNNGEKFNVLNDEDWPPKEKFGLDEMQYEAFKAALTKELAIIQGPPGTGKTFIGLMIVETIIKNMYNALNSIKLKKPITVVCYTNHALDQFMEGIIKFTKNVARIGGQTKSQIMKDYSLKNITQHQRKSNTVFKGIQYKTTEINKIVREIKYLKECKEVIIENAGILELSLLKNGMPKKYHRFFESPLKYIHWLFGDYNYFNFDPITFLADQESVNQTFNSENFLEIKNLNNFTKEDISKHKTENSIFEHEDIVIYCLTINGIKTTCDKYIKKLNDMGYKKLKLTNTNKHYSYREQIETICCNIERIHNYLTEILASSNNDFDSHNIVPKNLYDLKMKDRWLLYFQWVNNIKNMFDQKVLHYEKYYADRHKQYLELKEMENIQILSTKHVVAMTTTGASKHRVLLEGLQSPIVIVEEAAEVLEAHIIASLTRHCQHLILIGDHKQLRPNNAVYKLAKDYHFNISLFERMVNSGVPYYALREQHRMRPEVSSLITPAIYSTLLNHPSVLNRPHIRGVTKDLFFLNHSKFETQVEEISSKSNDHEASFLIMFARHLILQDYKPDQVTILTTYNGQMFKLRSLQKQYSHLDGMKIQVVDNYQGEESDIILLSLVRSNESGKVGFLKTENRICVALSRAKNGLYIMGNMENLYNSCDLWKNMKQKLIDHGSYGDELTLECAVHHGMLTKVSKSEDFKPIIEGGCTMLCNVLLNCGHYCPRVCHSYGRGHEEFICQNLCNKSCENNHPCKKKCGVNCGICLVPMIKILPCNHQIQLPCHIDTKQYKCNEKVEIILNDCGHKITKYCHEKNPECIFKCTDRLECGHACNRNCHKNNDPEHELYKCNKPCTKINKTCSQNHKCQKRCYEECSFCTLIVDKVLECGHLKMKVRCGDDIKRIQCSKHLPCNRILECGHKCQKKCFETCDSCNIIVTRLFPECGHKVEIECQKDPNRKIVCTEKCSQILSCGHKCKDICGNKCDSKNCKELVLKEEKKLACGHDKMWVFCCDKNKEFEVNSEYVLKKCQEPCLKKLVCGDICSGTCAKCKQGRLHIPCEEKCTKINPCNHTCKYPCKEACPPCDLPCTYSCAHSKCPRKCGAPCVPCQEPCVWKCKHYACTNACFEQCNRPPCYVPCEKKLKCRHRCIGFCGEPCPPLCRVCDKDKVTKIIFGTEDAPGARFVYLEDCKHTVESVALERWLEDDRGGDGGGIAIAAKRCPLCSTAIATTLRFSRHTKTALRDVAIVKSKLYGVPAATAAVAALAPAALRVADRFGRIDRTDELYGAVRRLWDDASRPLMRLCGRKRGGGSVSLLHVTSARTVESWTWVVQLAQSFFRFKRRVDPSAADPRARDSGAAAVRHWAWLLTVALRAGGRLTDQQRVDVGLEMARGARLVGLHETLANPDYQCAAAATDSDGDGGGRVRDAVRAMEALLTSCDRYYPVVDKEVQRLSDEVADAVGRLVRVTDAERKMIHAAMSTSFHQRSRAQGHWLKCKNGHIYCVTECGGPMERAQCPVCRVPIGGANHAYVPGTTVASEMDGATHPAWSEANNMNNYELDRR